MLSALLTHEEEGIQLGSQEGKGPGLRASKEVEGEGDEDLSQAHLLLQLVSHSTEQSRGLATLTRVKDTHAQLMLLDVLGNQIELDPGTTIIVVRRSANRKTSESDARVIAQHASKRVCV